MLSALSDGSRHTLAVAVVAGIIGLGLGFLARDGREHLEWSAMQRTISSSGSDAAPAASDVALPSPQATSDVPVPFAQIEFNGGKSNPLLEYFAAYKEGPVLQKWMSYFEPYHRHFARFRGRKVNFLEIGIQSGGAIAMWQSYFGKEMLSYYGVDINFLCKEIFGHLPGVSIAVGDQPVTDVVAKCLQSNSTFWDEYVKTVPPLDIILDDGGHRMEQQIVSFQSLYPYMAADGIYMVEDTLTSYWADFGGGYRKEGSFLEYSKLMIDHVNGNHITGQGEEYPSNITRNTVGFHVYDNQVVWERGPHGPATDEIHGTAKLPYYAEGNTPEYIQQMKEVFAPFVGRDGIIAAK